MAYGPPRCPLVPCKEFNRKSGLRTGRKNLSEVDYTGRLFHEEKAAISAKLAGMLYDPAR